MSTSMLQASTDAGRRVQRTASEQIEHLIKSGPTIAVDTEFEGAETLLVQLATDRADGRIVQLYLPGDLPEPDHAALEDAFVEVERIKIGRLDDRLSPARYLQDLFGLELSPINPDFADRMLHDASDPIANAEWNAKKERWIVPTICMTFVTHFALADFTRLFGRTFLDALKSDPLMSIHAGKTLGFRNEKSGEFLPATIQYVRTPEGDVYGLQVDVEDTCALLGGQSLDALAKAFLGESKADDLSPDDKTRMRRTIEQQPERVYRYAVRDACLTLSVYRKACEYLRDLFLRIGAPEDRIPVKPKKTMGGNIARLLELLIEKDIGESPRTVAAGSASTFELAHNRTIFGADHARVHGGLLFSRSPDRLFIETPGQMRDVDMRSCYAQAIDGMRLYLGRPVILEPGAARQPLSQTIAWLHGVAPRDGWMVRVSGEIPQDCNALIPSSAAALSTDKIRSAADRSVEALSASDGEAAASRLYSREITLGVVTADTWAVIEQLPEGLRQSYEDLKVDAVVFYPHDLIVGSREEYDNMAVADELDIPWSERIDTEHWMLRKEVQLIPDYVALRFDIGRYVRRIRELRTEVQQESDRKGGLDLVLKLVANALYGVLASPHYNTNNFVAANIITARARAAAFVLSQTLNGVQTITDGCTYRADQIPAGTFAEVLADSSGYPLRRPDDDAIPWTPRGEVPEDDRQFGEWFVDQARRFFDATADSDFATLIRDFPLEHKRLPRSDEHAFDALVVCGAGDYVKCRCTPVGPEPIAMKARGFGRQSRERLMPWLAAVCSADRMESLPPIVSDEELLKADKARRAVGWAIEDDETVAVVWPLGWPCENVKNYAVLKPSAFVCQNAHQHKALVRAYERLRDDHGIGFEILVLRRAHGDRPANSIRRAAMDIHDVIRIGGDDFSQVLNLSRQARSTAVQRIAAPRMEQLEIRRRQANQTLWEAMRRKVDAPTGLVIDAETIAWLDACRFDDQ